MPENPYLKRERLLKELREECDWEGAILLRIDGKHGASLMCDVADDASMITIIVVNCLGEIMPELLSEAYKATGATTTDTVDRKDPG